MSCFAFSSVEEPVTWKSYKRSYSPYDSNGTPYPSDAVVLYVSMCCEECVQKVRKSLRYVDEVESVDVDIRRQRVVVRGYHVDPDNVLRKVQKQNKTATFWDRYVDEYSTFTSSEAYDYHRPTTSFYRYKSYGPRSPSNDYAIYTSGGSYDYSRPTSSIDSHNYYDRSPMYVYSDNYPSSSEYSRQYHYDERYPSYFEYPNNDYRTYSGSYGAYRSYH